MSDQKDATGNFEDQPGSKSYKVPGKVLKHAIELILEGQTKKAGELLSRLVQEEPQNENAWLWLAACKNEKNEKISCLEKVLAINPKNSSAKLAMQRLTTPVGAEDQPSLENILSAKPAGNDRWKFSIPVIVGTLCALVILIHILLAIIKTWDNQGLLSFLISSKPSATLTSLPSKTYLPSYTYTPLETFTPSLTVTPLYTPTITQTPTLTSSATPTFTATPYIVTLPANVKTGNGWEFIITDVIIKTEIGDQIPAEDYFVIVLFEAHNKTGVRGCLKTDQFAIASGLNNYKMETKILNVAKEKYSRDYPGPFFGQCAEQGKFANSLLVFDVPDIQDILILEMGDQQLRLGKITTLLKLQQ